ncbi:MAG: patatin-like phospholipase family protein [Myxococcota bacterium]|nr:patatin-like phospholipase family protein [Myxococcota bacterium]
MIGITLAGGGARGAYKAGVIRYLYKELPKKLGYVPWPKLVSGVSVGSINGYFLATHKMEEIDRMTALWTEVQINKVYNLPLGPFAFVMNLIQASRRASLIDASPLARMVEVEAARRGLRYGIHPNRCHAFLVATTHMTTSQNVIFADVASKEIQVPTPPGGRVHYGRIYPEHILASGAVPLILQPISIDGEYYLDGGLQQYAPLSPLIQMGANKILVLGTRSKEEENPPKVDSNPSLSIVSGYALNALSLDYVERDIEIAQRMNRIIDFGVEHYGKEFRTKLRKELGIRKMRSLHLRPSINLGQLAQQVFKPNLIQADANTQWLLSWLHEKRETFHGDATLSYLLFDPIYTRAAEQLGFEDTQKREEELLEFFTQSS